MTLWGRLELFTPLCKFLPVIAEFPFSIAPKMSILIRSNLQAQGQHPF